MVEDIRTTNGARVDCPVCHGSGVMPRFGNFVACVSCFPRLKTTTSDRADAMGIVSIEGVA